MITILAQPLDTAFRLPRDERLPVTVTSSSGDRETVGLYRAWCPARERGPIYPCFVFSLYMRPGGYVGDLADDVRAAGGFMQRLGVCVQGGGCTFSPSLALVWVFDPDDLMPLVRAAQGWPMVAVAEPGGAPGCVDYCQPRAYRAELQIPVRVGSGPANPEDGLIQLAPGDTLRVFYKQPDGLTVQGEMYVP